MSLSMKQKQTHRHRERTCRENNHEAGRHCSVLCSVSLIRVRLLETPWTVAHQAPLSLRFPRQEYWSGLPLPSPGDLPNPGIQPRSLVSPVSAAGFFTTVCTWEVPNSFITTSFFFPFC